MEVRRPATAVDPREVQERVKLEIPIDSRYVRLARIVVGDMAAASGSEGEAVNDLGAAVDELCTALIEVADGGSLDLLLVRRDDGVEVHGHTTSAPWARLDEQRWEFSERILAAACDRFNFSVEGGIAQFTLQKVA